MRRSPRHVQIARRTRDSHRALHRGDKCRSQTVRVDRTPKPNPRRCQKRGASVGVDPLDPYFAPAVDELRVLRWRLEEGNSLALGKLT
jgi:hypothetical protein